MKTFIVAVLALLALQAFASPTPEEMYGSLDKDGKYRQMQEQVDQMIQKSEEATRDKAAKQQVALWVALAIGFIPLCAIGKQVLSKRTWDENPSGTRQALAIGLAGAAVLFGLNYGIFLLKIEYGSRFNAALAAALVLLFTIGAIYVVRKKITTHKILITAHLRVGFFCVFCRATASTYAEWQNRPAQRFRVVGLMRKHEEKFPEFATSDTAILFTPPIFENKKKASGYFF